jgi:mono/diheme cytochrome c family protein
LTDSLWIYGGQPENIFASIVEGRPNGMLSFRGKIPEDQVWKIVAYVMAFLIVAEPPDEFAAWLDRQRRPAVTPADARQQHGQEVFLSSPCVMCHTIRGTLAGGKGARSRPI